MKGIASAVLAALCIGSVGIWVTLIGGSVPVMTVNFLRVFLAAIFLAAAGMILKPGIFKLRKGEIMFYLVTGLLIGSACSLFNTAFHYLSISQTYLLDALFPFFVLIVGGQVLNDGIRLSDLISLTVGAIALFILNPFSFNNQTGVSIMFVEVLLYALMIVYMRKKGESFTLKNTFWFFFFASLFLSPFPFIYGFGSAAQVMPWLGLLGFLATGLGYICFNYAVNTIKTEAMSISLLLGSTIFAIAAAVIIFKEVLPAKMLVGAALLLLSGTFLLWMRGYGKGKLAKIIYYPNSKE